MALIVILYGKEKIVTTEYHCIEFCPKCGCSNSSSPTVMDGVLVCEAQTKCNACGFHSYWAYGFFDIGEMEFKGKRYINDNGVLKYENERGEF